MTSAVTILLVDEEPLLRRATALLLAERGGKVSAVATMSEALALTRQRLFDVAVIDIAPGGPDPDEVFAQLRDHGLLPRRMIACACSPVTPREPLPFTAVLQKPYVFEHLLAAVFGRERRPAHTNGASPPSRRAASFLEDAANDVVEVAPPSTERLTPRRGAQRDVGSARSLTPELRRPLKLALRGARRALRARRGRA